MSKNVVFDFDGVIHSYKSGWQGVTTISDPPVFGIKEEIDRIRANGYNVFVVSTRCKTSEGLQAVKEYLDKYNIIVDGVDDQKPPAIVYIDDRALKFNGDPSNLLEQINTFKTWLEV